MNLKHLLTSGMAVVMLGLVAVGCNENDPITPGNGNLGNPTNLRAVSLSATSVGLTWTAPTDTGVITYMVSRVATSNPADTQTVTAAGTSATFNGLTAQEYTFTVKSVRSGSASTGISMKWAPAARFMANNTVNFRLYEKSSTNGSGMNLGDNGPTNVSLVTGTPGIAQLALYLKPETGGTVNEAIIGPVYAIPEYKASSTIDLSKIDTTVYISDSTYLATSLDTWFSNESIANKIGPNNKEKAFVLSGASLNQSQGFYVRTGLSPNYHYARILIKAVGGSIIQGTGSEQYVEMDISYQKTPNLPYAKRGTEARGLVPARTLQ